MKKLLLSSIILISLNVFGQLKHETTASMERSAKIATSEGVNGTSTPTSTTNAPVQSEDAKPAETHVEVTNTAGTTQTSEPVKPKTDEPKRPEDAKPVETKEEILNADPVVPQ